MAKRVLGACLRRAGVRLVGQRERRVGADLLRDTGRRIHRDGVAAFGVHGSCANPVCPAAASAFETPGLANVAGPHEVRPLATDAATAGQNWRELLHGAETLQARLTRQVASGEDGRLELLMADYEYDVAISFLAPDEPLALQTRELLLPLRVFVFSKEQESLAGEEGVGAFREVFRRKARVALVLFRPRWGNSPWTRVEETAIVDHCLEVGWDHLIFVKLEKAEKPTWVPDSYLYLDFQSFGMSDLVGAVKAKCARLGVELKTPTAAERAAQLASKEKFDSETESLVRSSAQPLYNAAERLFAAVRARLEEIQQRTGWPIVQGTGNIHGYPSYVARAEPIAIQLTSRWEQWGDVESYVAFRVVRGALLTPEEYGAYVPSREPRELRLEKLRLARVPEHGWCWQFREQIRSTETVAELIANDVVEYRERERRRPLGV